MMSTTRLLLIGCGNMAGAMLAGWLEAGANPAHFSILTPTMPKAPEGVALYRDPALVPDSFDAVLLGFKPQKLAELAPGFQDLVQGKEVHSLLAGITLAQLREAFPGADQHLRVMPNLAARINKSPVILAHDGMTDSVQTAAFDLYDQLGTAVWLADEAKFDLATALAGSGPGFVYRFIDALAEAATQLGLEAEQSAQLAKVMVEGAAQLAGSQSLSPAELADRVAAKGGMTREGLNVLDAESALLTLLTRTLDATARRGAELSANNG